VILIGHSMSGAVIVETALQNPDRIIGLVGVDNFKYFGVMATHADSVGSELFYKSTRAHFHDAVAEYVNKALFSPSTPAAVRDRVLKDMTGADSTITVDILQRYDDYPLDTKLVAVKKPLCLINSSFKPTDTVGFRKKGVDYTLFDIGPTGHYPMIEKPDSFNVLLGQAIARIKTAH
jgi:pimeloyl-ACP methyl ester carboxylesterase